MIKDKQWQVDMANGVLAQEEKASIVKQESTALIDSIFGWDKRRIGEVDLLFLENNGILVGDNGDFLDFIDLCTWFEALSRTKYGMPAQK